MVMVLLNPITLEVPPPLQAARDQELAARKALAWDLVPCEEKWSARYYDAMRQRSPTAETPSGEAIAKLGQEIHADVEKQFAAELLKRPNRLMTETEKAELYGMTAEVKDPDGTVRRPAHIKQGKEIFEPGGTDGLIKKAWLKISFNGGWNLNFEERKSRGGKTYDAMNELSQREVAQYTTDRFWAELLARDNQALAANGQAVIKRSFNGGGGDRDGKGGIFR